MTLTHYLLRSRDGLYFTGDSWAHRVHAKRYALREHAERQTFVTLADKIHVKVIKVSVRRSIPFKTTPKQLAKLLLVVSKMFTSGMDVEFVLELFALAREDQGVFDLVEMWDNAESPEDRVALNDDFRQALRDYGRPSTS